MLNTRDAMALLSNGAMSAAEVNSMLVSMGHSREDCAIAFAELCSLPDSRVRVGKYQKGEYHAEIYLTVVEE